MENEEDINVVGEAKNEVEAIKKIKELEPDIVLLDVRMPELNGSKTLSKIN